MINPDHNKIPAISVIIYQYSAYQKQIKACIGSNPVGVAMPPRNVGG